METDMTTAVRTMAPKRVPMDAQRKTALTVGVLFVLTLVFAIPGVLAYGPVLNDPFYVLGPGAGLSVSLGAFFEILTVIANIATAMVLFPLLRRQNETIALSYVAARFIEGALIVVGMLSLLAVETLRQDGAAADPGSLLVASQSLVAVHDWTFLLGPGFMSGLGNGLLLGYLMYRSGLLSRRLTTFGIIGGPLVMASGIAVLFGVIEAGSTAQGLATILEIVWEIGILGLVLIFKGFQPAAAAVLVSGSADKDGSTMAASSPVAVTTQAGAA
jgi:hypothetical protein